VNDLKLAASVELELALELEPELGERNSGPDFQLTANRKPLL
jgi:hypothetical protein